MSKKPNYKTEDGAQIAPLSELKDFQVAEGYRDIRGWRVDSADGTKVGEVHDLLVDLDGMRTRYLEVRLDSAIAATRGDRDVIVPIGTAQIAEKDDVVVVPLNADRVTLLPPYDHGLLTRSYESEVRRHFSLGEAAAASVAGAATTDRPVERTIYDDEAYDDRKFFKLRPRNEADATETRIPVEPEDSVVLKRGDGGRDEIIVRRPST